MAATRVAIQSGRPVPLSGPDASYGFLPLLHLAILGHRVQPDIPG